VKSVGFRHDQAEIIDGDCIYCGHCLSVCPQNAKHIVSELPQVKEMIEKGERVYVSLAPAFAAAYPGIGFPALSAALKKLGFLHVEETAIGADIVTREYEKLMREHKMKNIISTCCSSTVF
jgi:iron only hydrogenase large subunit-like protein